MANMQGGSARRNRNMVFWSYINSLARTSEQTNLWPGSFSNLPDWSSNSTFKTRLMIIENADHNADEVFGSKEGQSALFSW